MCLSQYISVCVCIYLFFLNYSWLEKQYTECINIYESKELKKTCETIMNSNKCVSLKYQYFSLNITLICISNTCHVTISCLKNPLCLLILVIFYERVTLCPLKSKYCTECAPSEELNIKLMLM